MRITTNSLLVLAALVTGCSSTLDTTSFTNPQFDFGFVERAAVLPLENLSNDSQAAQRATRILVTGLLASGAVDVVEQGEVRAALDRIPGLTNPPSTEQVINIGATLGTQALIVGSITQSEVLRSGTVTYPVVTIDLHMLETETGVSVWAATHTEKGSGVSAKLLGTGGQPISDTTRKCIRQLLDSLLN